MTSVRVWKNAPLCRRPGGASLHRTAGCAQHPTLRLRSRKQRPRSVRRTQVGQQQEPVGQGALPVVDVSDDAEVADVFGGRPAHDAS